MTEIKNSGTERVYAESNWYYSLGEAERNCLNLLEQKIRNTIDRLTNEGKRAIGGTHNSIESQERVSNDTVEYKCSGTSEINWVYSESEILINKGVNEKLFKVNNNPELLDLEDELLNRFKKKYNAGYHAMTLSKPAILKSDVKVGEKISSLPNTVSEENYILKNCTPDVQTKTIRVSVTTTEGETFSFNKSITSRDSTTLGLTFSIGYFGGSASNTQSRDMTIGSTKGTSTTRNETYQEDFQQRVNPSKALVIKIKRELIHEVYILDGYLIFDATVSVTERWKDVYACGPFGTDRCSRWKEKTTDYKTSQFLSLEERTFYLNGDVKISSSKNTRTTSSYVEKDIDCSQEGIGNNSSEKLGFLEGFEFNVTDFPPLEQEFTELK